MRSHNQSLSYQNLDNIFGDNNTLKKLAKILEHYQTKQGELPLVAVTCNEDGYNTIVESANIIDTGATQALYGVKIVVVKSQAASIIEWRDNISLEKYMRIMQNPKYRNTLNNKIEEQLNDGIPFDKALENGLARYNFI